MLPINLSDWTVIGPDHSYCYHLWKQEGKDVWAPWATVAHDGSDDYGEWEFRQCVVCGTKQIREPQS